MKYTKYIIYGNPIKPDELGILAIPTIIPAIPILTGFLIGAIIMDSNRYIRLQIVLYQRKQRKLRYIRNVIYSLDKKETKELIYLLTTT